MVNVTESYFYLFKSTDSCQKHRTLFLFNKKVEVLSMPLNC